jgi:hypothetical protein
MRLQFSPKLNADVYPCLTQIPKLGNRPRRRARPRFIGFCAEKRADLPGNYFVPFV